MVWVQAPFAAGMLPPGMSWGESLKPSLLQAAILQLSLTSDLPVKVERQRNLSHQGSVDQTADLRPQTIDMNTVWIFSASWRGTVWYFFSHQNMLFLLCCCCCHLSSDFPSCLKQQLLRLFLGGRTSYSSLTTCHLAGNQPSFEKQSVL